MKRLYYFKLVCRKLTTTSVPPLHSDTVNTCSSADASVRTQLRRCDKPNASRLIHRKLESLSNIHKSPSQREFSGLHDEHMIIFLSQSSHLQDGVAGSDLVVQQGDVLTLFDVCTTSAQENIISDGC